MYKIRGKIYQRSQRLREICLILEELIIFRNFSSHHTYQRNDLGLSLKVSSSLLRYIEILDLPIKWKKEIIKSNNLGNILNSGDDSVSSADMVQDRNLFF